MVSIWSMTPAYGRFRIEKSAALPICLPRRPKTICAASTTTSQAPQSSTQVQAGDDRARLLIAREPRNASTAGQLASRLRWLRWIE